jgi:UDP-3-O-[3-hydroxymyristoyl] glucosamine N-acyltransferase
VSIGANGRVGHNVTIHHDVSIGANAVINSGAVIGSDGFGFVFTNGRYEKFPQIGRVEIGDDVELGVNSCVDRAALGVTRLGDGVKLDNLIHVAHNCEIGDHVISAAQAGFSGGAKLGNYVVVGGQVGLGERAVIQDKAVAGGQCGLLPQKTIPAGETYWGTPARPIREHLAQLAQLGKLASLREKVAGLERRIAELESTGQP